MINVSVWWRQRRWHRKWLEFTESRSGRTVTSLATTMAQSPHYDAKGAKLDGRWNGIIEVLEHAGRLKQLPRQGWIDRGVASPESVADHSYRLGLLVLLRAGQDSTIDLGRALTIALVHDLPEAIAGDATPFDQALDVPEAEREAIFRRPPIYPSEAQHAKHAAELAAMEEITRELPSQLRELISGAWEEYEEGKTAEAQLVRQADKLESWLQALEYREEQARLVIESFSIGTDQAVTDPSLRDLLDAIRQRYRAEESRR
jgi:putative hydrolase of HD superfamily